MGFNYSWISWTMVLIAVGVIILFLIFPWLFIAIIKFIGLIVKTIVKVVAWVVSSIVGLFSGRKAKGLKASKSKGRKFS